HLGHRRAYKESGIQEMPLTLVNNPSHLEYVNPVLEGHARASQDQRSHAGPPVQDVKAALPILIHGDAAFPGQGIVAETLNLSGLPGYTTGGTIHIIANNQIGFTTTPPEGRSTLYASDLAKGFEIPIVHVNADDPPACLAAARMAHACRERFHKDFLIDLIGYRRYGHNEGDEPEYTQPQMYALVRAHPSVRQLWAQALEREGIVSTAEAAGMLKAAMDRLKDALKAPVPQANSELEGMHMPGSRSRRAETAVPAEWLQALNEALLARPTGFTVNPKLERQFQRWRTALTPGGKIEWGQAEALAFASILAQGTPIRLTGQDTERGTFSHRHAVLHDVKTDATTIPLQALPQARASFAIVNSPLSENAVLGFEYGYSIHAPGVLVLWEAQFGDFANSAQVIIDQFLAAGAAKWRQNPSLTLLLPHGYEGQGPEHSSARVERFLQLASDENIQVANCTTSGQYFHLLRRQAALLETDPRPLVIFTPKSLLRSERAASSLEELAQGAFRPVLDDAAARAHPEEVTRLILCSGKVYVDLVNSPGYAQAQRVAVARVEELYPFPAGELQRVIGGYPNLRELTWLQEEPRNMGAWSFVQPLLYEQVGWEGPICYIGRPASASPAEGSAGRHAAEQSRILVAALEEAPVLTRERSEIRHAS
ncbi:MAG TPA: 2-oxoglutarate dehydrogenase E1 component, partial [Chthonomonadaceae bacterium]|nr:2-oxoglutarate dehydrogenase E1 component [Chthonomonadaceae bacterium]